MPINKHRFACSASELCLTLLHWSEVGMVEMSSGALERSKMNRSVKECEAVHGFSLLCLTRFGPIFHQLCMHIVFG